jgi:hypothetical protein
MRNRFNINESEKNRIRGLHNIKVINEQGVKYTPEDRITDGNCTGTATPKVVLDIFKDITRNYGYECIGRAETMTSGEDPQPITKITLKKDIQGVSVYVFIDELNWGGLIEVGDVSYVIPPKTAPGDSVYYKGEEGDINQLGELEVLEDKILDSI